MASSSSRHGPTFQQPRGLYPQSCTSKSPKHQQLRKMSARPGKSADDGHLHEWIGYTESLYSALVFLEGIQLPTNWQGAWRPQGGRWVPMLGTSIADSLQDLQPEYLRMADDEKLGVCNSYRQHFWRLERLLNEVHTREKCVLACLDELLEKKVPYNLAGDDEEKDMVGMLRSAIRVTMEVLECDQQEDIEELNRMLNPDNPIRMPQEEKLEGRKDEDHNEYISDFLQEFRRSVSQGVKQQHSGCQEPAEAEHHGCGCPRTDHYHQSF